MSHHTVRLEKMRLARQQSLLAKKSPHEIGNEKKLNALHWTYQWGWTSPTLLGFVARDNKNGLCARLIKQGYLNKVRTEAGGGVKGIPTYMLLLTSRGVEEVERTFNHVDQLLPYCGDPTKINQIKLRHDYVVQRLTAEAYVSGGIARYFTERQCAAKSEIATKQPDVIWQRGAEILAIEVELSAKWGRELDTFVRGCVLALYKNRELDRFLPDKLILYSDSPAIIKRYRAAFKPGAIYNVWEKNGRRHWQVVREVSVPSNIENKVRFELLDKTIA